LWLVRVYDQPNLLASICWIPWIVLLVRRCLLTPSLRGATALAVVGALQFLAGYPPAILATVYLLLLGIPFWGSEARRRAGGALLLPGVLALVVAGCVCLLLVAAQLLPTAELAQLTDRQSNAASVHDLLRGSGEASPTLLVIGFPHMTIAAAALDFWRTFGPVLIALGLLAVVAGRRRASVWWLLAAVVLCGLLPYPAYVHLPFYGFVRWALEWRRIAPMMVFMLAACGLDAMLARGWLRQRAAAACALAVAVMSLGWNWRLIDAQWLRPPSPQPMPLPDWIARDCGPGNQAFRAYWPAGQTRASLFAARVRSIGGYETSLLPPRSVRLVDTLGIGNGIVTGRWDKSLSANRALAARMGLRCVPPPLTRNRKRFRSASDLQRYLIQHAQPRVRLVRQVSFAGSGEESLRQLRASPGTAVLETAPEQLPGDACTGPPGTATVVRDAPEEVRIATDAPCAAYLVLADTNLRGWSAQLDGREAAILTADYAFRAVRVPAGRHEVRFRYAPWTVSVGIATSLAGLAVAVGLALLPRRYDPLRPAPAGAAIR
jgi:hypothetical protein